MLHSTQIITTLTNKLNFIESHFPQYFRDTILYKNISTYSKLLMSSRSIGSTPESMLVTKLSELDELLTETIMNHINNYQSND